MPAAKRGVSLTSAFPSPLVPGRPVREPGFQLYATDPSTRRAVPFRLELRHDGEVLYGADVDTAWSNEALESLVMRWAELARMESGRAQELLRTAKDMRDARMPRTR